MKSAREVRNELLEFIRRDLVGPSHGEDELLDEPPILQYLAGVLFPQDSERNESEAAAGIEEREDAAFQVGHDATEDLPIIEKEIQDEEETREEMVDTEYDDAVTLANSYRPSAMGLSFMVEPPKSGLIVNARAAVYGTSRKPSQDGKYQRTEWLRRVLNIEPITLKFDASGYSQDFNLDEGLELRAVVRPRGNGRFLVTVSLYNSTRKSQKKARTFFQVGMSIESADGSASFVEYGSPEGLPEEDEELALAMLYRKRCVFAIGHGCAADWSNTATDRTVRVFTEVIPSAFVPPIMPRTEDVRYLSMQFLRGDCADPGEDIPIALYELCDTYESWIVERETEALDIERRFKGAAKRHLELCRIALRRMRAGVELLASDERSLEAFMLVNRVMLMQQHHSRLRRRLKDPWTAMPDASEYVQDWEKKRGYWYSFQLAFILMSLPSLVSSKETITYQDEELPVRDIVDLIWFPTGGGKTEAYLGVTAFVIFTSRPIEPEREACLVLMRYTLRLLTSQQFQRAASLICACELVRRENPEKYGAAPISIGLWVGMSLTPNDEKDALRKLTRLERKRGGARNPFQLLSCPWCGTELNNPEKLGYAEYKRRQVFICPGREKQGEDRCPFSKFGTHLPVCLVDESIYERPPTLIIGTVDKFAMLAWRERAGRIFSVGGGPDLVIQDELHLISGPLGSIVGLYESVIDFLCSTKGSRPKIIASTATIRRANEQCQALYDRPMFQFPPPGLDASDSYFAVEDTSSPGRIYVGLFPTASSSPLTAQIRSVAALQQGAVIAAGTEAPDEALDPYWTLVQYFGSLKELGRAATFITADIPEFLPTMHRRYEISGSMRRWMRTAEELTSRKNEDEIPKILKRLEARYKCGAEWEEQALDTVLATNMISVGVDIERLGLMMIVTQPKGTSEYIQASSRVGRSNTGPGLIFTLYNFGRPRDRSHYEQFRGYHDAFYRFVEPSSVTPFAPPAMQRALHAVLVIAGRHIAGWKKPTDYDREDEKFEEFLEFCRNRVRRVDGDHFSEFEDLLCERLDDWKRRMPEGWGVLGGTRDETVLMRVAGTAAPEDDPDSWETPTSMRNVDVECGAEVIPRYLIGSEANK